MSNIINSNVYHWMVYVRIDALEAEMLLSVCMDFGAFHYRTPKYLARKRNIIATLRKRRLAHNLRTGYRMFNMRVLLGDVEFLFLP